MIAFLASLVVTGIMIGVVILVARRRPPGAPLSWGEAMAAGVFVFTLLLMFYGVVPNQFLQWADKDLKWRSDKLITPFWAHGHQGISFFGRGRILISYQVLRDAVATIIYLGLVGLQLFGWVWWQKRGKATATTPELPTSAYGRPLVRKV